MKHVVTAASAVSEAQLRIIEVTDAAKPKGSLPSGSPILCEPGFEECIRLFHPSFQSTAIHGRNSLPARHVPVALAPS